MKKSKIPWINLKKANNFFTENHKTSLKKIEKTKKKMEEHYVILAWNMNIVKM